MPGREFQLLDHMFGIHEPVGIVGDLAGNSPEQAMMLAIAGRAGAHQKHAAFRALGQLLL